MKTTKTILRTGLVGLFLMMAIGVFGQTPQTPPGPIDPLGPENPTTAVGTTERGNLFDPALETTPEEELLNSILFFNPDQPNAFTLRASAIEEEANDRGLQFTNYIWTESTDGTSWTVISGESGETLPQSGLAPGYHHYRVEGIINPDNVDESLLCESLSETFVVYVLAPLAVSGNGTSTNPSGEFVFCEAESQDESEQAKVQLSATAAYGEYDVEPTVEQFQKLYRWYAIREKEGAYIDVSDKAKEPTTISDDVILLGEGTNLEQIHPQIDAFGKYQVFVEVEYVIKSRTYDLGEGISDDPENRKRPYVIYSGFIQDEGQNLVITVTPKPGKPHITIEAVND